MTKLALAVPALLAAAVLLSPPARALTIGGYVQVEGGTALFSDSPDGALLVSGAGYGARAGVRLDNWGVFIEAGHDLWLATELERSIRSGVVNAAVGAELRYFDERLRASLAVGTSTLLFDAALDPEGTTGLFVDLRPAGIRFDLADWFTIELQPLTFTVMAPVLADPAIVRVAYRSLVVTEVSF